MNVTVACASGVTDLAVGTVAKVVSKERLEDMGKTVGGGAITGHETTREDGVAMSKAELKGALMLPSGDLTGISKILDHHAGPMQCTL